MNKPLVSSLVLILSIYLSQSPATAQIAKERLKNFDRRESRESSAVVPQEKSDALAALQSRVLQARVDFDPIIGAPKMISATDGFLTGPSGQGRAITNGAAAVVSVVHDPDQPTKAFLQEYRGLFGHGPEVLNNARIKRESIGPKNGLRTVVWQQEVQGIPVFEAVLISHTTLKGELVNLSSAFVPEPAQAAARGVLSAAQITAAPPITARAALKAAAENVGEVLREETIVSISEPEMTAGQPQKFQAPVLLGEATASLTWLPMSRQEMRLCWDLVFTSRSRHEMFRVLVDAQSGEVQVRRCLTEYLSPASYLVFTSDSPTPFSPGYSTPDTNQPALVSRTLVTLSALSTNGSPNGWIDDGGNETLGNNVDAHTDLNDDDYPDLPRPQGSSRTFDFAMDAAQSPSTYRSAAVVQLFYACNWMHDKLYDLGFTEAAGNFQSDNFSRGGYGGDAVQADAQDGGGYNNANFSTPPDGSAGRMQMYVFNGPTPDRDGDFDMEIVLHEYTHGLSNRRVGGGVGMSALQSEGMGEGWSDFYGMALLSESGDDVDGNYAAGAYASQLIGSGYLQNYYFGIRRYPYTTDMTKNPLTFKDIDPTQADNCSSGAPFNTGFFGSCSSSGASEVHNVGEVWCVTLWEARANLIKKYGWATGNQLILQLVTDGMNLSPANPNFLQARDAILQADVVDNGGANLGALWSAFAKRGMGLTATSPSSSTTYGLHEAFDLPDSLQVVPADLTASGPVGGPFSPSQVSFTLTNSGTTSFNWSLINTCSWLTVSPASGSLTPGGSSATVTATVGSSATNLSLGIYRVMISFTNHTSGIVQGRTFTLNAVGRNMFDAFDPGIDLSQWSGFGGVLGSTVIATNYGGSVSGPNSLWFGDGGTRSATTIPVNTSGGGTIAFSIRLANGSSWPWEEADYLPYEGVALEVSTNNEATWTTIGNYDTTAYYNWTSVTFPLPAVAQGAAAKFRWRQLSHSGNLYDHWAIDDVSIDAGPTPPRINAQPLSQTVPVGGTLALYVGAGGSEPLSYQWRKAGSPISGATASTYTLLNAQTNNSGVYSVVVSNLYGTVISSNATVNVAYVSVADSFNPSPNGLIYCTAFQSDGKILIGGSFTTVAGQSRSYLARLNPDGTLDSSFNTSASSTVYSIAIQPDGKILVGGSFYSLGSYTRNYIGRLNADGTVDPSFNPGANSYVYSLVVQADGRILVGGYFSSLAGSSRYYIGRLNVDGTIDSNFNPGASSSVYVLATQPDGKILAGGSFYTLGGVSRSYIGRLNADGTVDTNFNPGANSEVYSMLIQPDEKILVGGWFSSLGGQSRSYLGRLNADGTLDSGFNPSPNGFVISMALQADGKIVVGGGFSILGGQSRSYLGKLLQDGTLDDAFNPGASSTVYSLAIQSDGKILAGGYFATLGGQARQYFGRLTATGAAVQSLSSDGSSITWLRSGSTPEVALAWFEGSSNGVWTALGTSTRISGGWQVSGVNWPTNASLRARGSVSGGTYNGSGWFVETSSGSPVILGQPLSQLAAVGGSVDFTVVASGSDPLSYQWRKGNTAIPGATAATYSLSNLQLSDAGVYSVTVSNLYGGVVSTNATLSVVYVSVPDSFNPNPNGQVYSTAIQTDGKILVGGNFSTLGGQSRSRIGRLNPDGTVDMTFNPGANSDVYSLAIQSDGKILVGGSFSTLGGQSRSYFGRLNPDGTVDSSFNPMANGSVYSISVQPDDRILVGGGFSTIGGYSRYYIARLNPDGTVDTAFNPGAGNLVYTLAVQPDGKILVGGAFSTLAGQSRFYFGRLLANGALDASFNPNANSYVYSLAVQSDGRILAAGSFSSLGGYSHYNIGRMNSDGTIDSTFNTVADGTIYSMALQADGKILLGGGFYNLSGLARMFLARLNVDGTTDANFNPAVNSYVYSLALQSDGKILVGGSFSSLGGQSRNFLGRLTPTDAATDDLSFNGSSVTWLRGGSAPELWRTVFEGSANGSGWTNLGSGTRISGGWQLTGLNWPTNASLRARGFVSGCYFNGSGWLVETVAGPPVITNQPVSQIIRLGNGAALNVGASGTGPLSFQWRKSGIEIFSATNALLGFSSVSTNDAGDYDVVVANGYGAVTSLVATLTVYVPTPPLIVQQPVALTVPASTNVMFNVIATGDMPLVYQWLFNDDPISGATDSTLNLTNVQSWNQGNYRVVITNSMGSLTSSNAALTVTPVTPQIVSQPTARGVFPGFNTSFSVGAVGSEPFTYQWRLDSGDLPGATNNWLNLTNVQAPNSGFYTVVVRNQAGEIETYPTLLALVPVASWGLNDSGQNNLPVELTNAVSIAAGGAHNVALRRDGTVVAWGAANTTNVPPGLTGVISVAAGGSYSLALKSDGSVVAWGDNSQGQTEVPGVSDIAAIAAGGNHSLALRTNGIVVGWGANTYGQLNVPFNLTNVVAIAAGSDHSLALKGDGKVFAWGLNTSGQCTVPTNLTDVVAIAAGGSHSLALRSDGTVVAWGNNSNGQIIVPAGLSNVVAIVGGAYHTLALRADGSVAAWGAGSISNLLSSPHWEQSVVPACVTNVSEISGGAGHSAAFAGNGAPFITESPANRMVYSGRRVVLRGAATGALPLIYQWQLNGVNLPDATNQLLVIETAANTGDYQLVVSNSFGTVTSSVGTLTVLDQSPFVVTQPANTTAFLGGNARLQVTADGSGPFWYQWRLNGADIAGATNSILDLGYVSLGQAGYYSVVIHNAFGTISSVKALISVSQVVAWGAGTDSSGIKQNYGQSMIPAGLTNAVALSGGLDHTLALLANGKVQAWGAGTLLSSSPHYGQSIVPPALINVTAVAAGGYHSLALKTDGTITAWGAGTVFSSQSPHFGQSVVPVLATNILAIAAGDFHSVALRNDGRVLVWGNNSYLQTNVPIAATSNVIAIASRGNHILALKGDGSLVHWGSWSSLPVGASNIVMIAAGMNHCLALKRDGTIISWGGQYPVPFGLSNVVEIAAGTDHSVALRSDGTVVTWGATNTFGRYAIPNGLSNVVGVACGAYHSLAFLNDGSPVLKWNPANTATYLGAAATFSAGAVGASLICQWQFNGVDIPGATNLSLRIAVAQATDAGNYRIVITNAYGAVTSSVANLAVLVPLGNALDASGLVWSISGNASWFGETNVTHDGIDAGQSGAITNNQLCSVQTTVAGPGNVSFWWKVSSEEYFDFLSFYIDGVVQTSIAGEMDWQSESFPIGAGLHVLKWSYVKDSSVSGGWDTGWLDEVAVTTNAPVVLLDPVSQTNVQGGTIQFTVLSSGAQPLSYQWMKAGTNLPGETGSALTLYNLSRRDTGLYAVSVNNPGGTTVSSNAFLKVYVAQQLTLGGLQPDGSFLLISADRDGGTLSAEDLANFEVQASTNLSDWATMPESLTITNGSLLIRDNKSTNYPARFYRVLER